MFGKVINLPFKVLAGVARAVQAQEAKRWDGHAERDAEAARATTGIDISVPDDFKPGDFHIDAKDAVALLETGCVLDVREAGGIPGAIHIPSNEVGIRLAELPADIKLAVVADQSTTSDKVVLFLRHRGLDDTWSVTGGMAAWSSQADPPGETHE
jgi:rhodanese-related sulfurtransferase